MQLFAVRPLHVAHRTKHCVQTVLETLVQFRVRTSFDAQLGHAEQIVSLVPSQPPDLNVLFAQTEQDLHTRFVDNVGADVSNSAPRTHERMP